MTRWFVRYATVWYDMARSIVRYDTIWHILVYAMVLLLYHNMVQYATI